MKASLEHHRIVERFLRDLMARVQAEFSLEEIQEVEENLEVGEYGLALETLSAIVVEEDKRIDDAAERLIDDLARMMHLTDSRILDDYYSHMAEKRAGRVGGGH